MKKVFLNAGLSSLAEQEFNKSLVKMLRKYNFEVYSPQEVLPPGIQVSATEIYNANLSAIAGSDIILCVLDKPGLGVIFELAQALAMKKKVIIFRSDIQDYLGKIIEGLWESIDNKYKAQNLQQLNDILENEGG